MNYADVRTLFLGILNRSDCPVDLADQFIKSAFQKIQRDLRIPSMEKVGEALVGEAFEFLVIPQDFIELIDLSVDGESLEKLSYRQFIELRKRCGGVGYPRYYARMKDRWLITPTPTEGQTITTYYYADFEAFESDADENTLSVIAPDLIAYAALCYAADWFAHESGPLWEARYAQILAGLAEQQHDDEFQGGTMVVQSGYAGDY